MLQKYASLFSFDRSSQNCKEQMPNLRNLFQVCLILGFWQPLRAFVTHPSGWAPSHFSLQTFASKNDESVMALPTNATTELYPAFESALNKDSSVITIIPNTKVLDLWKRRLITHEDAFSLHKLASVGYTISSAILLGNGLIRLVQSSELFAVIQPEMEIVMNAFTVSNIMMCFASVRMAFIHRQGDLTARNAFLGTAVSSLFSGFFMVWISPFPEGDIFNSLMISRIFFAVLVGLNGFFIADTIIQTKEIVEGRRDRKAEDYKGRKVIDTLGYVFPVAWGMPLIAATGLISCVIHDRAWFMEQCQFIDAQIHHPGMQSHIFYQQLSTSLAASYASLFVTLRDKKLINKMQELGGITIFALPALIWSIYTTYIFTSYLFVAH